ncbi:hypothetical protein BC332_21208 [Capsicum chinense]|nr:hypothetical protein BC332_21208 [Capsicum chinense]
MKLFGATTITRKIILEGGLVVVDDGSRSGSGSSSGVVVGANDAPLTVFEKISHYDYDHTGCTNFSPDFATSRECSACKSQDCKVLAVVIIKGRRIRVYDSMSRRRRSGPSSEIQKLGKILSTYLDMSGFLDQRVRTDWSTIEAYRDKISNPFDVQYVEGIAQQTIDSL